LSRFVKEIVDAEGRYSSASRSVTRQAPGPDGFPRYGAMAWDGAARARSGELGEEAARTGHRVARRAAAAQARRDRGMIGVVVYLVVLVAAIAGVYIAWREGSTGGGRGGVVAGAALLVAAVVRLALPARFAGLLASRRRLTDVLMLTAFGAGLLIAGLVLPRLGPLSAQGRMAGPPMKGKYG
jgi:Protein of unknown function (DUF3017)